MTEQDQKQLGATLWAIADKLRGAMNADDFRDYMLSFLFLRYLSDNYEAAAKKELGTDYPTIVGDDKRSPLAIWYQANANDVDEFEKQMRRKVHYVVKPEYLWSYIAELARTQNWELLDILHKGFKYIENESFQSTFQGLFSEINLDSEKLGKRHSERNAKLCAIISKIADGVGKFTFHRRHPGRCLRIPDRPVCRGLRQESGRVLYTAADFHHPIGDSHARQPGSGHGQEEKTGKGIRLRLWFRFAVAQCAQTARPARHR